MKPLPLDPDFAAPRARIGGVTPILRIFDVQRARDFYVDFLGFRVDWEHRFSEDLPLYLQVSRDDCVLHLSEHHGDGSPGVALRIRTRDVPALQAQLASTPYRFARPRAETPPWGGLELTLLDPFGNRLVFVEADASAPPAPN